jgi:hypothetical protein
MKIKKSKITRRNAVRFPPTLLFLVFTILGALVLIQIQTIRAQSQESKGSNKDQSFPVVDYDTPSHSKLQPSDKRLRKNGFYDRQTGLVQKSATGDEALIETEWAGILPALPVYGSDAVVLGEVKDAQAFLSNDKSGVYSEFTLEVEQVFKDDLKQPLSAANVITLTRFGGSVRYSPTRSQLIHVVGQRMPLPGKRYVFFLQRGADPRDYSIKTAYEIQSGRVHPLDGSNAKPPQPWAGDAYENTEEAAFLNALQDAIAKSPLRPAGQ